MIVINASENKLKNNQNLNLLLKLKKQNQINANSINKINLRSFISV